MDEISKGAAAELKRRQAPFLDEDQPSITNLMDNIVVSQYINQKEQQYSTNKVTDLEIQVRRLEKKLAKQTRGLNPQI
jgi:flagellar motility protein MotE (MotC chaperone)